MFGRCLLRTGAEPSLAGIRGPTRWGKKSLPRADFLLLAARVAESDKAEGEKGEGAGFGDMGHRHITIADKHHGSSD